MRVEMTANIDVSGDSLSDVIDTLTAIQDRAESDATISMGTYSVEVSWTEDL